MSIFLPSNIRGKILYPETREVHVYAPAETLTISGEHDDLDGGAVWPGFRLEV